MLESRREKTERRLAALFGTMNVIRRGSIFCKEGHRMPDNPNGQAIELPLNEQQKRRRLDSIASIAVKLDIWPRYTVMETGDLHKIGLRAKRLVLRSN
jgi:hypothetical protein